jgi:S-adenosylmethionine hydrolase
MKAAIWALAPQARIIDLGHHTPQNWPAEAGFWLGKVYPHFAPGSVHVAVVDPGVGSARAILAASFRGQYFLAPDNGILPMIDGFAADAEVRIIGTHWLQRRGLPEPSATFHGRDIFAPVAACLACGTTRLDELGARSDHAVRALLDPPAVATDHISGRIATIDSWGNLLTNIDRRHLAALGDVQVEYAGRRIALRRTYADVAAGGLLALINSFDSLEIAASGGSAESLLGARRGDEVRVVHTA